mmetsp:Transcript_61616/g.107133  ORF Transcript_61616/g.107133 Transcript_61616/m.107133 type:complete len:747 (-) Transcript_61616:345-2585(-)
MAALKNNYAASQKRGPQRFKQQGGKTNGGAEIATASSASTAAQSKSQRSSGQQGPRRGGRAPVTQKAAKKATAARNAGNASGKAGESCAWPAYARSAAEAEEEVLEAIRSLYADELKPFGRILRKRVAERILQGNGQVGSITKLDALPEVDAKQVRAVCDGCELLQVQEEDGGDWSAVVGGQPSTFVDVYSPEDCYHPQLWCGLRTHCESSAGQDLSLPGGRYACAQALMALQLPLLAGFSLGRICHIVQLAISQKKILGYMNGAVVPYARSQSMMKEQCAMYGQPTTGNGNDQNNISILPIASLEVARKHVLEILETAKGEAPLSNIKRLFRSRFQIELSETSFGYSKLSELLQGPSFSDICRVELRGHGYTVIQTGQLPLIPSLTTAENTVPGFQQAALLDNGSRRVPLCVDEPLAFDDMNAPTDGTQPAPVTGPFARRWCVSPSKDIGDGFVNCSVQHTFLQYKVPQTPLPGPKRRSRSVPTDMGRNRLSLTSEICSADVKFASARTCRSLSKASRESESTTDGSVTEDLRKSSSHRRTDSSSSISTELSTDEASFGFVPQLPEIFWGRTPGTTPLPSPAPKAPPSIATSGLASQFPSALASLFDSSLGTMGPNDEVCFMASGGSESGSNRVTFCPDEPLGFDEADVFPQSPRESSPAVVPPTPSPLPLYNYSETIPWRRHPICSSLPQPPPRSASPPFGMQLGCSEIFSTSPPIQSGSVFSTAPPIQSGSVSGCVLRLGEYL